MQDTDVEKLLGDMAGRNFKIATAESLTCGLIGSTLTRISGASVVVNGGFMVYSDAIKNKLLDVPVEVLARFTAVSEPVARYMAQGALRKTGSQIAVAVTGYAGSTGGLAPGSDGLVYIGLAWRFNDAADGEYNEVFEHRFAGNRDEVRQQTVDTALGHVKNLLGRYPS